MELKNRIKKLVQIVSSSLDIPVYIFETFDEALTENPFLECSIDIFKSDGWLYKNVFYENGFFCTLKMPDVENSYKYMDLMVNIIINEVNRTFNKKNFIKEYLEGDCKDIHHMISYFNIKPDIPRMLFLISTKDYENALHIISNIFPDRLKNYIIPMTSGIVLIKEAENFDMKDIALQMKETLISELLEEVEISFGGVSRTFYQLPEVYRNALEAMKLGRTFGKKDKVYIYDEMGIEKFISDVPPDVLKTFYNKFVDESILLLMDEIGEIVEVFLKNNMNITESAKIMYLHRNTLLYKIEKIKKVTGYDLKKIEDILTLRIFFLIKKYLDVVYLK